MISGKKDQKIAGAKKVVKIKNQFFHTHQPRKSSYWCCIFTIFGQSFKWPAVIQETDKYSVYNIYNWNFRVNLEFESNGFGITSSLLACSTQRFT